MRCEQLERPDDADLWVGRGRRRSRRRALRPLRRGRAHRRGRGRRAACDEALGDGPDTDLSVAAAGPGAAASSTPGETPSGRMPHAHPFTDEEHARAGGRPARRERPDGVRRHPAGRRWSATTASPSRRSATVTRSSGATGSRPGRSRATTDSSPARRRACAWPRPSTTSATPSCPPAPSPTSCCSPPTATATPSPRRTGGRACSATSRRSWNGSGSGSSRSSCRTGSRSRRGSAVTTSPPSWSYVARWRSVPPGTVARCRPPPRPCPGTGLSSCPTRARDACARPGPSPTVRLSAVGGRGALRSSPCSRPRSWSSASSQRCSSSGPTLPSRRWTAPRTRAPAPRPPGTGPTTRPSRRPAVARRATGSRETARAPGRSGSPATARSRSRPRTRAARSRSPSRAG